MTSSKIELLNIDCMEYMRDLPDNSFDLIVTSPPYDELRDYGGCDWGEEVWQKVIGLCYKSLADGGVMVWVVGDSVKQGSESCTSFRQAIYAVDVGFNLHDTMIWCKDSFSFPEANRYPQCFEYMFVFSKGKPSHFKPIKDRKTKHPGVKVHGTWRQKDGSTKKRPDTGLSVGDLGQRFNYWEISSEKNSRQHNHPAAFPVKLAYDHIVSWSDRGMRVFDPFLGSGSSAIAAHLAGVDFVGCEIDKDYYENAVKRFNAETAQVSMEFA